MSGRTVLLSYLFLGLAALFWAGNFVLGRWIHTDIPPVTLAFWRWAVAAVILAPLTAAAAWRHRHVLWRERRLIAVLAVLGVVLFHVCVYLGLKTTPATNAALLQAAVPVVMPAFSWVLLGERASAQQMLGILVSLAGVLAIVLRGRPEALAALRLTAGDVWILASVPVWALYSTLLRRLPADLPRLPFLFTIACAGLVVLGPLYALEVRVAGGFAVTPATVLAIGYVGLFASVLAYVFWNRGVLHVGPNKAGLFMHLIPVFATILAVLLLGERLLAYHGVGIALIAGGILLTVTGRTPPAPRR